MKNPNLLKTNKWHRLHNIPIVKGGITQWISSNPFFIPYSLQNSNFFKRIHMLPGLPRMMILQLEKKDQHPFNYCYDTAVFRLSALIANFTWNRMQC
jgi:hypothetical protein